MLNVQTKNLGGVAILSLAGQVVIGQTDTLRDGIQSLSQTKSVILDLSSVTLIDAHGLGVLLQLREQLHANGVRLQLTNVGRPLREILQITRLEAVFQINSATEIMARPIAA